MVCLLWLVLVAVCCALSSGQECNDPTNPAVQRLYNRDCTPDTVTIHTGLQLTLRRGDTYGRDLVVYGRDVILAEDILNPGRTVTIVANTLRCGSTPVTISTVPLKPNSTQSLEYDTMYPGCGEITCGNNGKSATYVAPNGGNITLVGGTLLCDGLNLTADGGMGAAGQNGEQGKACKAATDGASGCADGAQLCYSEYLVKVYKGKNAEPGTPGGRGGNGGAASLPGSGGTVETRFVNQTAPVRATAGIGTFPGSSAGGAGGDANCNGAGGGSPGLRLSRPPPVGPACTVIQDSGCLGAGIGAPAKGSPGSSGPNPQTSPGAASLRDGAVMLDQLPGAGALLPYYDKVQLDMILGEGNARYVANDYSGAGDIFAFLTSLTGPCLAGAAGPSNCNSTFTQAGTSLQQMQQGFSFNGRPNNWVPLLSAQTLNNAIVPLLEALKTVETIYVTNYLARAKDQITKQDLQTYISQSVATTSSYQDQIGTLQQQYKETAASFSELVVKRTAAALTLQTAGENFKFEILNKLQLDLFLDGVQAIASIATASVPDIFKIANVYEPVAKAEVPSLVKDAVVDSTVVGCKVLTGILKDGLSGFLDLKQKFSNLNQTDAFKNFVDNEEFENFIESFKTLPGYKMYGKALKDYKNVCLAASAKVLAASGYLNQILSLRGQIDNLRLTASQANERLGRSVNPADALYSSFFEDVYSGLSINIRAYLYQAYQALTYTSLAVSSPPDDSKISDYAGLVAAFAAYQNAAVQALAKAGGEKQQFPQPLPDTTFVVTRDNALNWDQGLATGRLQFLIPTSTPKFMSSKGLVTINEVDIRYIGAQRRYYIGGGTTVSTSVVHEGTPTVRARNCTDYSFVHDRTVVLHTYDIYYSKTTQRATFNYKDDYIKLSPFTTWTLDFSRDNEDIDFSRVTSIALAFTGEFAALDDRTCIDVRTGGMGISVVPEVSESDPDSESAASANFTSFAAADAVGAASILAHPAEDACPAANLTVQVNPTAAATSDYYFGAILLDNGQLPFELPQYNGVAHFYAVPLDFPLNCTAEFNPPFPFADLLLLGSAPFEAVAGSTAYEASFALTSEMGMRLKWKQPTMGGEYHVIVNVTSTSDAELYDDTIDACFTYKCGLVF